MRTLKFLALAILLSSLQSCWWHNQDDDVPILPIIQSNYTPVIMKRSAFEASTVFESPRAIINSGKIYVKSNFLFINEKNQGFHVFNNSNPENPINIGFLKVLGASDLAIKDNAVYVNNAVDLIAIEPNFETSTIEITKRIPNTFPQLFSPEGFGYYNLEQDDIIVDWILND